MLKTYLKGWLYWWQLRIKLKITYHKVVIVLAGENRKLDKNVLAHLKDFMVRKYADRALIICKEEQKEDIAFLYKLEERISVYAIKTAKMDLLYSFYSFMKFFDNIVFTYTDRPGDNLLERFLNETDVDEEAAACLALYHLRCVSRI